MCPRGFLLATLGIFMHKCMKTPRGIVASEQLPKIIKMKKPCPAFSADRAEGRSHKVLPLHLAILRN